jgi:hypothetical protein
VAANRRFKTIIQAEAGILVPAIAGTSTRTEQVAGNVVKANYLLAAHSQPAYRVYGDGKQEWGPGGTTVPDTNLYRPSAHKLKTDDSLDVALDLTQRGQPVANRAFAMAVS